MPKKKREVGESNVELTIAHAITQAHNMLRLAIKANNPVTKAALRKLARTVTCRAVMWMTTAEVLDGEIQRLAEGDRLVENIRQGIEHD